MGRFINLKCLFTCVAIATVMLMSVSSYWTHMFTKKDKSKSLPEHILRTIPRLQDCKALNKTVDNQCKLLKVNKTSGHLRLPYDQSFFDASTRNLGITEPWKSRLRLLQQKCRERKELQNIKSMKRFIFSRKYDFGYCKVAKTGGTFMINLILVSVLGFPLTVFQRPRDSVHLLTQRSLSKLPPDNETFKKIVVARDPYSRLFSAYVDKIFLFGFMKQYMEVAKQSKFRPYLVKGKQCGYITPFQDFLELYLSRALNTGMCNQHWKPISSMCNPCNVDFQLVLKTETLTNDVEFMFNQLAIENKTKSLLLSALQYKQHSGDVIRALMVDYVKYWKRVTYTCSQFVTYMCRLWEAFKILGYIEEFVPFPESSFKEPQAENDTNRLADIVIKTMEMFPLSRIQKMKQKQNALVAAYKQVKPRTIEKIKEYFKDDFLLFGYETEPPLN